MAYMLYLFTFTIKTIPMYVIKYTLQDSEVIHYLPRCCAFLERVQSNRHEKNAERDSGVVEWCQDNYGIV